MAIRKQSDIKILQWIVFIVFFSRMSCIMPLETAEIEVSGLKVSLKTDITYDDVHIRHIVQNILLFEEEIGEINIYPEARMEVIPSNPEISILLYAGKDSNEIIRSYNIKKITIEDSVCIDLKFEISSSVYQILNIKYDDKQNILKRLIVKSCSNPHSGLTAADKFIEGLSLEYRNHVFPFKPAEIIQERFILNLKGEKIIILKKEFFNRVFNDSGKIMSQSARETSYSYSGLNSSRAFYNVLFDSEGRLRTFDLLSSDNHADISAGDIHLEAVFKEYDLKGLPGEKTFKNFRISEGRKVYLSGSHSKFVSNSENIFVSYHFREFDIIGGTGDTDEDRKYRNITDLYNLKFNENKMPLITRVLNSHYYYGNGMKLHVFDSVRTNYYEYDSRSGISRITAVFNGFDELLNFCELRRLETAVLEQTSYSEPKKISVKIFSKNHSGNFPEQIISQDCGYIMNEAEYGELFMPPKGMVENIIPVLESEPEQGMPSRITFYEISKNTNSGICNKIKAIDIT